MSNILESFADHLQSLGVATRGQDLWIGGAPSSNDVPDEIWWVIDDGGGPVSTNRTGEMIKNYQISVFCRDRDYTAINRKIFELEEKLNCSNCNQISGFDTLNIQTTSFPIDLDLDGEDRKIGMLQVQLITYKEC